MLEVDDVAGAVEGDADGVEADRVVARQVAARHHPGGGEAADLQLLAAADREDRALGAEGGAGAAAFTSTKTRVRPSRATMSSSPWRVRALRATISQPARGEPGGDEVSAIWPSRVAARSSRPPRLRRTGRAASSKSAPVRATLAHAAQRILHCARHACDLPLASSPCSPPPGPSPSTASPPARSGSRSTSTAACRPSAIVGLPDAAVREARERVRAALVNCGFEFPLRRIVVNLAPASLRKAGPGHGPGDRRGAAGRLRPARVGGAGAGGAGRRARPRRLGRGRCPAPWRSPRRRGSAGPRRSSCRRGTAPRRRWRGGIEVVALDSLARAGRRWRRASGRRRGRRRCRCAATRRGRPRPRRPARPAAPALRARGRRRRRPQPADGRPARRRQVAGGRAPALDPAAARRRPRRSRWRGSPAPAAGSAAGPRRPARSAPRTTRSARPGWSAAATRRGPGRRRWPTAASSSSTSSASSAATRWRRCGRRWRRGEVVDRAGGRPATLPCRFMLVAAANPCPCGRGETDPECSCAAARRAALPGQAERRPGRPHRHPRRRRASPARRRSAARPGRPRRRCASASAPPASGRKRRLGPGRCNAEMTPAEVRECTLDDGAAALLAEPTRAGGSAAAPTTGCCGWRGRSPTSPAARRSSASRWRRRCSCGRSATMPEPQRLSGVPAPLLAARPARLPTSRRSRPGRRARARRSCCGSSTRTWSRRRRRRSPARSSAQVAAVPERAAARASCRRRLLGLLPPRRSLSRRRCATPPTRPGR